MGRTSRLFRRKRPVRILPSGDQSQSCGDLRGDGRLEAKYTNQARKPGMVTRNCEPKAGRMGQQALQCPDKKGRCPPPPGSSCGHNRQLSRGTGHGGGGHGDFGITRSSHRGPWFSYPSRHATALDSTAQLLQLDQQQREKKLLLTVNIV